MHNKTTHPAAATYYCNLFLMSFSLIEVSLIEAEGTGGCSLTIYSTHYISICCTFFHILLEFTLGATPENEARALQ